MSGISRVVGRVRWNFGCKGIVRMGIDLGGRMGYIRWLGVGREKDIENGRNGRKARLHFDGVRR